MINTLLFDLDGTLLEIDMDFFLEKYFEAMVSRFDGLVDGRFLVQQILKSTRTMVENTDPGRTNKDIFMEDFFRATGLDPTEVLPRFDAFYQEDFPGLRVYAKRIQVAREVLAKAREQGYTLVLATNPVFPVSAIRNRMEWAGIDGFEFELVTAYENMHFCKPHLEYYQEVLEKICRAPEECLMVGNDVGEDLVAGKLGIKTYLVTDFIINNTEANFQPDLSGSLRDFMGLLLQKRLSRF